MRHNRREIAMLPAAQNLRRVQRGVAACAHQPRMDFAARQPAAEAQRKTVVGSSARRSLTCTAPR